MSDDTPEPPPLLGRHQAVPRRRWRWLLPSAVVAGVAALALVGFMALSRDAPPYVRAVDRYLDAVERGNSVGAYQSLCSQFRRVRPYREFAQILQVEKNEAGGVTQHRMGGSRRPARNRAEVAYTVRREDGDVRVLATVLREDGNWRVCGFRTLGPAGTTTTTRTRPGDVSQ